MAPGSTAGSSCSSRASSTTIAGDNVSWEAEPLNRLAESDNLRAFSHRGFWQAMDTLRDKNQLEELWAGPDPPWKKWK